MSFPCHDAIEPGARSLHPSGMVDQMQLLESSVPSNGKKYGSVGEGGESECKTALMSEHFSPQKGGARSNPNERMLIPSYVHMTQPSEPSRSPLKVRDRAVLCSITNLDIGGPATTIPMPRCFRGLSWCSGAYLS